MKSIVWEIPSPKIIGMRKSDYRYYMRRYGLITFFTVVLFIGMFIGVSVAKHANANLIKHLDFLFLTNYSARSSQSVFDTFAASLSAYFLLVFAAFLIGLSVWGTAVIPFVSLLKGFGIGLSAGYLLSAYGGKGIGYYFLILLPGAFLSSMALIIQSRASFYFAKTLLKSITSKDKSPNLNKSIKTLLIKTSYVLILTSCAAILDMILTSVFAALFKF
ncbi:MAG: hypothetical protein Q8876_04595 [Bacillota bacterium]|nr:hypothetical protein [Bacillota bacterium]